jgi:ubiquinone/menaquinone biosynthesis C-methylase UbiE
MTDSSVPLDDAPPDVAAGAAGYTPKALSMYDQWVLGFYAKRMWRCPNEEIIALYNENVSGNHLDVGVGTGLFLDRCRFPTARPKITLLDLNPNCLTYVAQRISRYAPVTLAASVLEPIPLPAASFDSIGLNYVLHCLPGPMSRKAVALKNLRVLLKDGGVLFGATLLGKDWAPSLPAWLAMHTSVRMIGGMAVFTART